MAVALQVVYVNPAVATAELRAMSCCARHCDEPPSLPASRTCCGLTATASGPTEAPTTAVPAAHVVVSLLPSIRVVAPPRPVIAPALLLPVAGSGPPTFLAQRHLLL